MRKLFLFGIGWGLLVSSLSAELNLQGFLKTYGGINTHYADRWDRLYSHLQLQFSGRTGQRIGYRGDLVMRYNYLADRKADTTRTVGLEIYPAELYVDYYGHWLDVRVGQQYLFWGRADWVNPTDVFIPWDYTNMSSDIEDYRIPIPAVKMSIYPAVGHLELIYAPRMIPDKIPNPLSPTVGDSALDQAQFGLRYANDLSAVAWSVCAYHGWRKFPEVEAVIKPPGPAVVYAYNRLDLLGGDFIYAGHKWALKGEGAVNFSADPKGLDSFIANDNFYGVLGADWLPGEDFSLNLQGIVRYYFNFDPQIEKQVVVSQNQLSFQPLTNATIYSLSSVIHYKISNFIDFRNITVINLDHNDWFWLPVISWEMADATHLTLGGIFFSGPAGSDFGNSADSDQLFLQLKTSF